MIPNKTDDIPPPRVRPPPPRRLPVPAPPRNNPTTEESTITTEENEDTTVTVTVEMTTVEILDIPNSNIGENNHDHDDDHDHDRVYGNIAGSIFGYVTGSGFCAALATYLTCKFRRVVLNRIRRYRENRELGADVRKKEKQRTSPVPNIKGVQTITNPFYSGTTQEDIDIMRRRPYAGHGIPPPSPNPVGIFQSELSPPMPIETLVPNLMAVPDLRPVRIEKPCSFGNPPV